MNEIFNERCKAFNKPTLEPRTLNETLNKVSLTLRKKKLDEMIHNKRAQFQQDKKKENTSEIESEYMICIEKLNLPENIIFKNKMSEYFDKLLLLTESNSIDEVKFGILNIRLFISDKNNTYLLVNYNNNVVSDLLICLDKHINDFSICYEIMWIFINYHYSMPSEIANTIGGMLLTPKGYRLWLKIFNHNNSELTSNLIWMLNNITGNNSASCLNLITSNFYFNQLLNYFNSIAKNIFLCEPQFNVAAHICALLCHLLQIDYKEHHAHITKIQSVQVLLSFCNTTNHEAYQSIIYSFSQNEIFENEIIRKSVEQSPLLKLIIEERKFFIDSITKKYSCRLIGMFIYYQNLPLDLNIKMIHLCKDMMKSETNILRKDILWCLSNMAFMNNVADEIIKVDGMTELLMKIVHTEVFEIALEAMYSVVNLVMLSSMNGFLTLGKYHVFEFLIDILQKHSNKDIIEIALKGVQHCLTYAEAIKEPIGFNVYKDSFMKMGGLEMLEHLRNSKMGQSVEVNQLIKEILFQFFIEEKDFPLDSKE